MAAAGTAPHTTRSPASACKAWGTFGCTCTGPSQAGSRRSASSARAGEWYVILAGDEVPAEPLPATGAVTGIDMGIAHFLTTAEGEHKANPRHGKRTADALADAQRALKAFPRCKRDNRTARHRRAVEKVATLHRKVRRQRQDHAHKTALAIVTRVRRDRARTVEHREHGPCAKTQARPRQRGRVSPERSCSEGRG
jgi:hypothetical protein